MSKQQFVKQTSLESPGLSHSYQKRRASQNDEASPKPLNRSFTVGTGGGANRPRVTTSPLKRFTRAKEGILKAYTLIRDRLTETLEFMQLAHGGADAQPVATLLERTRGIEDILSRDHMKVAFFGRTSNGKSSVINALLHGKVLPAGIGHTTSCFCSVIGTDSPAGYLLTPGSQERQNVKNVQQLAHSLHRERLEPSSLVQVFWPKSLCPLLKDDVEFVDSPGIDIHPNVDQVIDQHCLDADVFVLVSNAESTLMTAEKSFFHRVSERLSKPNIFILNNRWDASALEEPDMLEDVKAQHLERDIAFLSKELRVTDEQTARNRVFFVSAKEVLQYRMREQSSSPDPGEGLADGHALRRMDFEKFEQQFKECISSAAIQTKFEQHHKQGTVVVAELEKILETEEQQLLENSKLLSQQLDYSRQRGGRLQTEGAKIIRWCEDRISAVATDVDGKLTAAMKDVLSQLGTTVDGYEEPFHPNTVETYKQGLYTYVDSCVGREMERVGTSVLGQVFENTQKELLRDYQELLQLPDDELAHFSQRVVPPELTYVLRCADLCADFTENLNFRFSLGIPSLLSTLDAASNGSWVGRAQTQVARLSSLVPLEYAVPVLLIVGGALLPRFLSLRVILPSLVLYGGVYTYERFAWTDRRKESCLKTQFVQHVRAKMEVQVQALCDSYSRQLGGTLGMLARGLQASLEGAQEAEGRKIGELAEQVDRHDQLKDRAKKLRNAVHLLQQDLQDFSDTYLTPDL